MLQQMSISICIAEHSVYDVSSTMSHTHHIQLSSKGSVIVLCNISHFYSLKHWNVPKVIRKILFS